MRDPGELRERLQAEARIDSHRIGAVQNLCGLAAAGLLGISAVSNGGTLQTAAGIASGAAFLAAAALWQIRNRILRDEHPASPVDRAVLAIIQQFSPICIRLHRGRRMIVDIEGGPELVRTRRNQIRQAVKRAKTADQAKSSSQSPQGDWAESIEVRGEEDRKERSKAQNGPDEDAVVLYRRWKRD